MAKSANQKVKLMRLYQLLLRQTDEEHPITVAQIIQELERFDIKAERKSIYDDLESLRQLGLDVQSRKGRSPRPPAMITAFTGVTLLFFSPVP